MAKKFRIPGVSFSLNRALGITAAKQKIARETGIPTTEEGRRRKFGPFGTLAGVLLLLGNRSHNAESPEEASVDRAISVLAIGLLAYYVCAAIAVFGVFGLCAGIACMGVISPRQDAQPYENQPVMTSPFDLSTKLTPDTSNAPEQPQQ